MYARNCNCSLRGIQSYKETDGDERTGEKDEVHLLTVSEGEKEFNEQQVQRAKTDREFMRQMAFPSEADIMKLIVSRECSV